MISTYTWLYYNICSHNGHQVALLFKLTLKISFVFFKKKAQFVSIRKTRCKFLWFYLGSHFSPLQYCDGGTVTRYTIDIRKVWFSAELCVCQPVSILPAYASVHASLLSVLPGTVITLSPSRSRLHLLLWLLVLGLLWERWIEGSLSLWVRGLGLQTCSSPVWDFAPMPDT